MRFQTKSPQQHFEGITTKERVHSQPCGKRSRSIYNFTFISSDFAFAGCMEEALLLANTGCSSRGREIKEKEEEEKKKKALHPRATWSNCCWWQATGIPSPRGRGN
jgi:hypothetical protein